MASPRVLILRAPGTNCDVETAFAFEQVGAVVDSIHVNRLISEPKLAEGHQILCFPGGFSYGDDIAAGRILAQQLRSHLQGLVGEFCSKDRLVLGICNGFQIMMRLGIFFPNQTSTAPATLTLNKQSRFEDRWVNLAVATDICIFLRGLSTLFLPIAHAEGRFVIRDEHAARQLLDQGQLGLRYSQPEGLTSDTVLPFPTNPNGAEYNVAGICDPTGRIFGLMPHPERHLDYTHHPTWTRRKVQPEFGEGRAIFKNAVDFFE